MRAFSAREGLGLRRLLAGASVMALAALTLAGCGSGSGAGGGATSATATTAPTATAQPTACAQVAGFASAATISLPAMEFPAGSVAPAPTASAGGPGQYSIATYTVCTPNNTSQLTVSTGKGPEPFTSLLPFYGWASWNKFPTGGDAQQACPGTCFAFNADDASKGLFSGAPQFLSVESVTPLANGLVTFKLRLATAPAAPSCDPSFDTSDDAVYHTHPEYQIYYDAAAGIQWPPLTRVVGDSAPGIAGQDMCSAGTLASVKAFMDNQFSSHGYTSVACGANDCWKNATTTVTMRLTSATTWNLTTPRVMS